MPLNHAGGQTWRCHSFAGEPNEAMESPFGPAPTPMRRPGLLFALIEGGTTTMDRIGRARLGVLFVAWGVMAAACGGDDAAVTDGEDPVAVVTSQVPAPAATATTAPEAPVDDEPSLTAAPGEETDPDCIIVDLDVVNPLLDFDLEPDLPNTFPNGRCTLLLDTGGRIAIGVYEATIPFAEWAENKPLRTNVGEPATVGDQSVFLTGDGVEGFIVEVGGKRAIFELELGLDQERPAASNWETLLAHVVDRFDTIKALPGDL